MALMVTLMNLIGAYLRYLPFSQMLSRSLTIKLWTKLITWSIFSLIILVLTFKNVDVNIFVYKLILYVIWLPYLAISLGVIKNKILQHIFVMGMQGIWILFLHTLSGSTSVILQNENLISEELSAQFELIFYFAYFIILLPFEQKLFKNMLPSDEFFKLKSLSKYISFLPLIMFIGYSFLMMNNLIFQTWSERLSRLILLFVFFIIYRSLIATSKYVYENLINDQNFSRLKQQLISLKDYDLMLQENQEKISIMRHDLRHHYRLLHKLLENGEISEAMKHIELQEKLIDETKIKRYSYSPLINAALTIYFRQAQKLNITLKQKVNLPKKFSTDENDLAILMSNLLENAIKAASKQQSGIREIIFNAQHNGDQFVLEITNFSDQKIELAEDGLPKTSVKGHGIGMVSLRAFQKKYDAYVDFSRIGNRVNLLMYWRDHI